MNRYLLCLLILFVVWLFYVPSVIENGIAKILSVYERQEDLNRSERVNKQANIEKNPQEKYQIYSSDQLTFLLDKTTGQTWRYFRKFDQNNNLTDDGWEAFLFDQLGSKGSTPEEAEEMYRESVSSNATK